MSEDSNARFDRALRRLLKSAPSKHQQTAEWLGASQKIKREDMEYDFIVIPKTRASDALRGYGVPMARTASRAEVCHAGDERAVALRYIGAWTWDGVKERSTMYRL